MLHEVFKEIIEDKGLMQSYIAKKLGITQQALSQKLAGSRSFTIKEFFMLCMILKESPILIAKKAGLYNGEK